MKIESLTIQNFLAIGEASLKLDERGLILIQGENKTDSSASSNGAGKSTIGEAISWVLWGQTARGESGDEVVNRSAGKDCYVRIELSDGDYRYQITRARKHAEFKNHLMLSMSDGKTWKGIGAGTTVETQKKIEKLLGMSREIFDASVYIGQERMPDIPGMTDKQLKLMVEEAAGVTKLQDAYEVARKELSEATSALESVQHQSDALENAIARLRVEITTANSESSEWAQNRKERFAAKAKEIKTVQGDLTALKDRMSESDVGKVASAIVAINTKIAETSKERAALKSANQGLSEAQRDVDRKTTMAKMLMGDLVKAKDECKTIDGRIGEPCTACGRPHDETSLSKAKSAAKANFAAKRISAEKVKRQLEDARKARESAKETLSELEASQTDITELLKQKSDLEGKQRKIQELSGQIRNRAEILKILKAGAVVIKGEQNPHTARMARLQGELDNAKTSLEKTDSERAIAEKKVALHTQAAEVFSTGGVRAHILDTATPFLNARTAHYLGHLSDGNINAQWSTLSTTKKGEMREKFKIDVSKGAGAGSFKGLSGGEKRKARLACAMALQDLVATRAEKPMHLFIADEIDDAVDEAGLERLMAILEEKARERETVLVISHNSLNSWIRQTITVINEKGVAHVSPT